MKNDRDHYYNINLESEVQSSYMQVMDYEDYYRPVWELNSELILTDPYLYNMKTDKYLFDALVVNYAMEGNTDLEKEIELSVSGIPSRLKIIIQIVSVYLIPFILWCLGVYFLIILFFMLYSESLINDEDDNEMIEASEEWWMKEIDDDLRKHLMFMALLGEETFNLRGSTKVGYGEKWGVMAEKYSDTFENWFDMNMRSIFLIQNAQVDPIDWEDLIYSDNENIFFSDTQRIFDRDTKNLNLYLKSESFSKTTKSKFKDNKLLLEDNNIYNEYYMLYNYKALLTYFESKECLELFNRKDDNSLDRTFINFIAGRYFLNSKTIEYLEGVRDYEYRTYLIFQKKYKTHKTFYNKKKTNKKKKKI